MEMLCSGSLSVFLVNPQLIDAIVVSPSKVRRMSMGADGELMEETLVDWASLATVRDSLQGSVWAVAEGAWA